MKTERGELLCNLRNKVCLNQELINYKDTKESL